MPRFIVLARFLLSPLLVILSACGIGGTSYSNRIGDNGHDTLYSKARVEDGVARFHCLESDRGSCHYTLYPAACAGKADCALAPLQRFTVARGEDRQIAGLHDFRVCVAIDDKALGADCEPAAASKPF
jgi:hypothetical protein